MSLALHLIAAVFPNAPTDFSAIGKARGWPVEVRLDGPPVLQPIAGTDEFLVCRVQRMRALYADGSERVLTIPMGFQTDCGTIPRFLRSIRELSPTRWAAAYVPHDLMYVRRAWDDGHSIGLEEADWILLLLLAYLEAPARERTVIYRGLRLGSWAVWYSNARRSRARRALGRDLRFEISQSATLPTPKEPHHA